MLCSRVHVMHAMARQRHPACVCMCVCATQEDYLRDGLNKTDAIVSSFDLNQAVAEVIPVVLSLAKKGCLFFLVKLRSPNHRVKISQIKQEIPNNICHTKICRT